MNLLPESAVELAARAVAKVARANITWDELSDETKDAARRHANAALTAALPAIREAVVGEVAKDAARYRWLRDHRDDDGFVDTEFYVAVDSHRFPDKWALVGHELDAAIDAALTEQENRNDQERSHDGG